MYALHEATCFSVIVVCCSVYIEVEYLLMTDKGLFKACLSGEMTAYQK